MLPADMSTTSLVGGGLIAGESLYALGAGIASLLGAAMSAAGTREVITDSKRIGRTIDPALLHPPPLVRGQLRRSAGAAVGPPALRAQGGGERAVAGAALPAPGRRRSTSSGGSRTRRPATSSRSARCWRGAGGRPRTDMPNRYARGAARRGARARAGAAVRRAAGGGVHRGALARAARAAGARASRAAGDGELADFYAALAAAEERHAEIFIELARPLLPAADGDARIAELARRETEILAALPHAAGFTEGAPHPYPLPAARGEGNGCGCLRRSGTGRR